MITFSKHNKENKTFKQFLQEKIWVSTKQPYKHFSDDNVYAIKNKWDVILFAGEYNPITRKEFLKILDFIYKNKKNENIIDHKTLLALVSFHKENSQSIEQKINEKLSFSLSFEERNFITSKFFGLKLFEINNINTLLYLLHKKFSTSKENKHHLEYHSYNSHIVKDTNKQHYASLETSIKNNLLYKKSVFITPNNQLPQENPLHKDEEEELVKIINNFKNFIQKNFVGTRILIVLDRNLHSDLTVLSKLNHFFNGDFELGILFWDDPVEYENKKINELKIPITGEMIKAIVLLDYEKPTADNLKYFSHKYKLHHLLNEIKQIHMKFNNENYHLIFKYLFPPILISKKDNEDIDEINYIVLMKMLSEMYLNRNKYLV